MKKYLSLGMALLVSTGLLVGCGGSSDDVAESSSSSAESSENEIDEDFYGEGMEFIIGFDAAYPPYGFMDDNGEYVGFDIELAEEVCERRGWELIKQPIDWTAKDMELNSGAIDVIWNGFTMTGREENYTFSDPYVDNSIVIVTRGEDELLALEDLADKVVMTQSDSSAHTSLEGDMLELTETFASLELSPEYNTAFMSLESGAIDAIAVDIGVAQFQLSSRGNDDLVIMEELLSVEEYAIGFRKGETYFRDLVQETLDEMVEDGTFMDIVSNYSEYNLDQMISASFGK